ncbi:MAG: hypothetical protein JEY94_04270 [Melioribacteraceae bacterium]|nr:hypothetical protein [Melioribacteraceae bacterium]
MKAINIIFIIFSAIFFSACDRAFVPENEELSFQITDHILSEYNISSIVFDKKGTAWIGTFEQGLIKYDGSTTIYNFYNSELPDSLYIYDLEVDYDNIVWLGTNKGLIKFNHKQFEIFNTSNSPLAENFVWDLAVDQNNTLWISSCRFKLGGLMKLNNGNWTLYTPENSELPDNGVRCITVDDQNNLWGGVTFSSVIKISNNNWEIYDKDDLGFDLWEILSIAAQNEVAYVSIDYSLSSAAWPVGPTIVKLENNKFTDITPFKENEEIPGYTGKLALDKYGNLWTSFHSNNGTYLIVYKDKEWIYKKVDIPVTFYSSVIKADKRNTIWIGTHEGIFLLKQ